MDTADEEAPNIDALVNLLRVRVEERRRSGAYSPDLEAQLESHFQRIVTNRTLPSVEDVRDAMGNLKLRMNFAKERITSDSRMPGGDALHKALAKAQSRQVVGILEQMREFADGVIEVFDAVSAAIESGTSHVHLDLVSQIDAALERVAGFERAPLDSAAALADLRRRVEELEEAERLRAFEPWYRNDRFEAEFRGTRAELLAHYRDLAARFTDKAPVLDIGCGRGEFLELLRELDVDARGIELDPELVEDCQRRGLDAKTGDGIAELKALPDESLGGIVLIQVVEHLPQREVADLALVAFDKLRPGGRIICETVNPQSLYVFAHSFYVDPTHVRPVHPAYLAFLFNEAGFTRVEIDWRSPPPEDDVLAETDDNAARLNRLLFAPQDFALVATK